MKKMSEKEKTGAIRLSDLLDSDSAPISGSAPAPSGAPASGSTPVSDSAPVSTGVPVGGKTSARGKRPVSAEPSDPEKTDRPAALSAVFSLLSAGANSKKMLREKLARKGFSAEESAAAIAEADRLGFIGEKRLLAAYVYRLGTKKLYGPLKIRAEAARKFDRASLDAYLDEAMEELDFDALSRQVAERCLSRGRTYVINKLRYLGYDGGRVRKTIHALDAAGAFQKTAEEEEE